LTFVIFYSTEEVTVTYTQCYGNNTVRR